MYFINDIWLIMAIWPIYPNFVFYNYFSFFNSKYGSFPILGTAQWTQGHYWKLLFNYKTISSFSTFFQFVHSLPVCSHPLRNDITLLHRRGNTLESRNHMFWLFLTYAANTEANITCKLVATQLSIALCLKL